MSDEKHMADLPQVAHIQEISDTEKSDLYSTEWTDEDEKRIRNQLDLRIVPTILVLYLLCCIDRASIGNARILGLEKDLNTKIKFRFNWALTTFYVSYILVEIPSNILLKKIGAKYYLPSLVAAFGVVSMFTAFVHNFSGLIAVRFFLGLAEGGLMPGIAYYLSCFYRRKELMFRMACFFCSSSLAGAFGGLLAAGLSSIPSWGTDAAPIHTWKNIFFFEGVITILLAGVAILGLPPRPDECPFLSEKDRYIALERINREHREAFSTKTTMKDVKLALLNINNNICTMGFLVACVSALSLSLFMPTILRALGWTALRTQFYTVPPYAVACAWTLICCKLSDKYQRRGIFCLFNACMSLAGYVVIVTAKTNTIKYTGVFFAAAGAFPNGPGFLSWGLNNAAGNSVRAISSAYIVAVGNIGAVIATWTYLPSDAPNYLHGHYLNVAAEALAVIFAIAGIVYTKWENKKRDNGERDHRLVGLTESEISALGYRHPEFRYIV